jgi:PPOX class probable F420-dependent enzyme
VEEHPVYHGGMPHAVRTPANARPFTDAQRRFLDATHFASVASTDPDGAPRQTVVWYRLQPDGRILLNGRLPRRWCANLLREPRVAISVVDGADGYRWLGCTGFVDEVVDDAEPARDHIVELARRYHPDGPDEDMIARFRTEPRITYLVRVTGIYDHLED